MAQRGGKRENSGRKKDEYETKKISVHIRTHWEEEIKKDIDKSKEKLRKKDERESKSRKRQ